VERLYTAQLLVLTNYSPSTHNIKFLRSLAEDIDARLIDAVKGRNWRLREASIRRYQTLLPELETVTGQPLPYNRHGILSLCFTATDLPRWESLKQIRQRQGWPLEIWSRQQVESTCPYFNRDRVIAGIYSPQDLQIPPTALTHALVNAAQQKGVTFHFETPVTGFQRQGEQVIAAQTDQTTYPADWIILTAGLGSSALLQDLGTPLPLIPVLGQGMRVRVPENLGSPDFQPVVNGDDIHLVPLGDRQYGVAATVEFPTMDTVDPLPQANALKNLWQGAIAYCPALAKAEVLETWYGLRPRPQGQAAPVVKPLEGYTNVILATGHYRNGVLLAPATAELVRSFLV
ncbi:MAG: FAD-dependent oxidoreductase, partial [Leptolyngbya sp. SIO1D8]|nr:FAD-dependent oxidoreductase [Leptolyngbya sp. SIO1D8]